MAFVGEALLGGFIELLMERLVSPELLKLAQGEGLGKRLNKWRKTLSTVEAVLYDAEKKQHTERAVSLWLDDLRDLAYDVDDILDEFDTEALLHKWKRGDQASTSRVRMLIPACCTNLSPRAVKIGIRLGSKMEEINGRFNDIVTRKDQLDLRYTADETPNRRRETLPQTCLVKEPRVYGREKDLESLLGLLLGEQRSDAEAQVSVICVVGMGGIGKTTLAQLVYNDEQVQSFFAVRAWACVSEDFDAVRVTNTILKSVTSGSFDDKDLNFLQLKLKEELSGQKFLVVLDDVWLEDCDYWTSLLAPFLAGAPGSTILITTRNAEVSAMAGTIPAYNLHLLSKDACLSLFTQYALGATNFSGHPNLQDIGMEIVERCQGLPLVAKTLGGLLRTKLEPREWNDVLKSDIWNIPTEKSKILPALMLSYHHLPSHLKRCFSYCSIIPKDYTFEEKELILLWMAEGLIQPLGGDTQMEDLASQYFHDLLSRSFFLQCENGSFLMHDLISDLAGWVARDICLRMDDRIMGVSRGKFSEKVRHLSYLRGNCDGTKRFGGFTELTRLQTFLPLTLPHRGGKGQGLLTHDVPLRLLPNLKCLRVLSLSGYIMYELPESVGGLKLLRYLDLSYTEIRGLPESITTLYNLETLLLEDCFRLEKLPSKLGNLVNLRCLNLQNASSLEGLPPGIGKLTCLRTLPCLVVGKGNCSGVNELGPLLHLRGELSISRLENAIEPRAAREAKLIEKPDLTALRLKWTNRDDSQNRASELEVLNMLQPHMALEELAISHYGGTELPTWLKDLSFPHMVLLSIGNCKNCTSLPPVGQLPSLKYLFIDNMASVKNLGLEFYGEDCSEAFRSLETLSFMDMEEWESWIPNGEFPQLRKLSIKHCPKLLGKLPDHLPLLQKVSIDSCKQLVVSISSFPELCKVSIEGSKGVVRKGKVDFSKVCLNSVSRISEFICEIEGSSLEGPTLAEALGIENCEQLIISDYQNFVSLAEEVNEQPQLCLPSTLKMIYIHDFHGLKCLSKAVTYNITCLEQIYIRRCALLTHFSEGQLPPTLKKLDIRDCSNMLILLENDDTNSYSSFSSRLELLQIEGCPSLKSLTSSGELPSTLKELCIRRCQELESIAKSFHHTPILNYFTIFDCEKLKSLPMGIHTLGNLDVIDIRHCPALVSFPDGGLLPGNLRELKISGCEKMQALSNCQHNIASLQNLCILECPGIVSFPREGFPTNLTSLRISGCNITEALLEWGLLKLTSLQILEISDGPPHLVTFPVMMLPATLTTLCIVDFPNLKCFSSKGFRDLASLKVLGIGGCENLLLFPENGLPPSLLHLYVIWCEKLGSFPEDGLPPSLQVLHIHNCPLLKERCKNDQGRDWFKIAHIPYVEIDGRCIYDPKEPVIDRRLTPAALRSG